MGELTEQQIYWMLESLRGGAGSIQQLLDEHAAQLDLARSPQSGAYTHAGALLTPYTQNGGGHPFYFAGAYIDWTGCNFGAGENTTVTVDISIVAGPTWRNLYTEVFLAAALPTPIVTPIPRQTNTDIEPIRLYNVYGVRIQMIQAAIGGGWNTVQVEIFDAVRGP